MYSISGRQTSVFVPCSLVEDIKGKYVVVESLHYFYEDIYINFIPNHI